MKDLSEIISEYNNTVYPSFTYQGIILNGSFDTFPVPYSPMEFRNGKYYLYILRNNRFYIASSTNGLNGWTFSESHFNYGNVFKDVTNYKNAYHKWIGGKAYYYFAVSNDGNIFSDISTIRNPHGEDITIVKLSNGKYRAYARMNIPADGIRTIGVMESANFLSWSSLTEILNPADMNDYGKEYYSMSVIETSNGFYGFLNVYDPVKQTVHVQLIFSQDGINDWIKLHYGKSIIGSMKDRKQLYAAASLINNEVYLVTISAKFKHDETDRNGRYYYSELWKIPINELYKFPKIL